ncbi:hypothetical protein ASZ78_008385 [Callipepla squamata]|uniref:Nuclear factor of activated T-cells 5 n=1 Tax=Callipepla squamata TaxID=9009 RepID=A0A226NC94_CALSU|nr:hypothetical protein ASZ78_008385 [Callipepla squamata]
MPSDFISLLSADLDLESPKSLYSKESVYDLLPKELQLPPSRETSVASMSQTSGGEAGSPPPAVVAADASSAPSSSSMGGACSSFTTSSSPTIYSTSVTDSKAMQVESCSSAVGVSNRGVSEKQLTSNTVQQQQSTPKRHTVLYISPPPEDLLDNSRMSCQDEGCGLESEQSCSMWMEDSPSNFSNMSTSSYNDNTEVPRKSRKRNPKQRPGIKRRDCEESNMDIFDADSAKAPHYVLSQLSTDSKGNSKAGNGASESQKGAGGKKTPMWCGQYPTKSEGKELKIVVQPETQHRARYLTEGSRGSVKDRTQQGFPTVKLEGHNEPVVLQVFVGNDSGRVKPHGFYQACRVTGRNTTPCKEVDIEGTTVIEVGLEPSNNMTLAVDCVGILKLRNADVEARIGIAGSKKKSTRARLVFRVNITREDGSTLTLQTPSSPILCTQPAGVPEILKKSLHSCSVKGEEEVFLIGKNFLKGTKVIFQENVSDENSWKAEAEIDMELFHQNHLIVKVPPYHDQRITSAVSVGIYVVTNAGRSHDVQQFTYTPDTSAGTLNVNVKEEISSPAQHCSFEEAIKATGCDLEEVNILPSALITPLMPSSMIKNEDVSPMEVSAEKRSPPVFKASKVVGPTQQTLESSMPGIPPSASHLPAENEKQQQIQPKVYNPETLTTIQTQDITQPGSFSSVSTPASGVSQLQNTIQQLQAGNFPTNTATGSSRNVDLVQQVLEAQQQLSSVLFSGSDSNEDVQDQLNADIFQQNMMTVQPSGAQQQGGGLFQQGGEIMSIQPANFMQQSPHSQAQLFHSQNPIGDTQNISQETQGSIFHSPNSIVHNQTNTNSSDQLQPPMFHSQSTMGVLQSSSVPQDQQSANMFLSQSSISNPATQEEQMSFFTNPSSISPLQAAANTEQPASFQQQTQISHIQSSMLPQEQPQTQPAQQGLFQPQVPLGSIQSSSIPQNQQGAIFQPQHSIVAIQSSPPSQEQPQQQQQNMMFSNQNAMSTIASQKQNMIFNPNQNPNPGSNQAEAQQPAIFHNSPQIQLVQGSPSSQEQQVTLFISSASMSALQNTGGAINQLQNSPASSQQTSGIFLFGIQNNCSQLLPSGPAALPDELMAISQPGQPQSEGQAAVPALLSQQIPETSPLPSAMAPSQNIEKIDDLLVSLQNQGNNMAGSF